MRLTSRKRLPSSANTSYVRLIGQVVCKITPTYVLHRNGKFSTSARLEEHSSDCQSPHQNAAGAFLSNHMDKAEKCLLLRVWHRSTHCQAY